MHQLLAICPYPFQSADTRYRLGQFIPGLNKNEWAVDVRPFMKSSLFQYLS